MQLKLISETQLTFENAFKMDCSLEEANKNVKELQASASNFHSPTVSVNTLPDNKDKPRWRCGFSRRSPDVCAFKNKECFTCGKIGHTKQKCRSNQKSTNWAKSVPKSKSERVATLEDANMPTHVINTLEHDLYTVKSGLSVLVVNTSGPNIFGRDWLTSLKLN